MTTFVVGKDRLPSSGVVVGRSVAGEMLVDGAEPVPTVKRMRKPPTPKAPARTARGFVYFMRHGRAPDAPIKIGWAVSPVKRLSELQCGTPEELVLIGTIRGTEFLEHNLHRRFKDQRIRREWFRPSPDLLELAAGGGDPMLPAGIAWRLKEQAA